MSRSTSGPGSRLKNCKCFDEIDRRIRLGWASAELSRVIQEEYKECVDLSPLYLRKMIDQYRATIPATEMSMASSSSALGRRLSKRVNDGLDELSELEKLYRIQVKRIEIDYQNEQNINKLLSGTGKEIYVAMKLLRQSADLKMDLGLAKRNLGTVESSVSMAIDVGERYGKDSFGKVISDPDSRRRVLGLAERLVALSAKAGIDAIEMASVMVENEKPLIEGRVVEGVEGESDTIVAETSDEGDEDEGDAS